MLPGIVWDIDNHINLTDTGGTYAKKIKIGPLGSARDTELQMKGFAWSN